MSPSTITLLFLLFAVIMFVLEKIPLGVTSMIVCCGLVVTGVLDVKTAFAGTWNDESSDGSCFAVELQIDRAAKTATGTGIDDFFLSKLT